MVVVGISGAISSGKDAIGRYLATHYGFIRLGMADALKVEVETRFPRTLAAIAFSMPEIHTIHNMVWETKPPIVRELLQEMGTEVRRRDDPDYWVKAWMNSLHRFSRWERIYCPDVRFRNEAQGACSPTILSTSAHSEFTASVSSGSFFSSAIFLLTAGSSKFA